MQLTPEIIDAAATAYDGSGQPHSRALEVALEVAATHLIRQVPTPAQPAGLTRAEAVQEAVKLVDAMSTAPTKSNGYTVDGWKAPTLADRVQAIQDLTATLLGEKRGPFA